MLINFNSFFFSNKGDSNTTVILKGNTGIMAVLEIAFFFFFFTIFLNLKYILNETPLVSQMLIFTSND